MPRIARTHQIIANRPHHVWFRGNNRRRLFSYAYEYRAFLLFLKKAMVQTNVKLHGFSLLSNHGHLSVSPPSASALSQCMQRTLHRYALRRNMHRKSSGKLFEERFGCKPIDSDAYLAIVHAYIDLNPWRAGLETQLGDYPWSSAWIHLGLSQPRLAWVRKLCTPLPWYESLGLTTQQRCASYRQWLADCQDNDRFSDFEKAEKAHAPSRSTVSVRRPNGTAAIR